MKAVVVADAGPLIGLARIGELELLRDLYSTVLIPPAVLQELEVGSARPGAILLRAALRVGWLSTRALRNPAEKTALSPLDVGEDEAIRLAVELGSRLHFLLLDDRRARRVALLRGLPVVGTAGVLLVAKERGRLSELSPVLDALERAGYRLSTSLRQRVLFRAGES